MIFFKKSTYLLVCPSLFHNFIPNETLEVFQGGHGTCKLPAECTLSSLTLLIVLKYHMLKYHLRHAHARQGGQQITKL